RLCGRHSIPGSPRAAARRDDGRDQADCPQADVRGGPDAITLRAIAREMGMTANAIYGYFATRDDLVTELIRNVSTDLADELDASWARTTRASPAGRIRAWAHAFRSWSLKN